MPEPPVRSEFAMLKCGPKSRASQGEARRRGLEGPISTLPPKLPSRPGSGAPVSDPVRWNLEWPHRVGDLRSVVLSRRAYAEQAEDKSAFLRDGGIWFEAN